MPQLATVLHRLLPATVLAMVTLPRTASAMNTGEAFPLLLQWFEGAYDNLEQVWQQAFDGVREDALLDDPGASTGYSLQLAQLAHQNTRTAVLKRGVIGIAGGADTCRLVVEELGYDDCIDRHAGDVPAALDRLCPEDVGFFLTW